MAFRDHLQNVQWKKQERGGGKCIPFTLEELQTAMHKLKKQKAPGPDKVLNELFMLLLDDHNAITLLKFYNSNWGYAEVPDSWKEAIVVSKYRGKGRDVDPNNYKPISLLNSIYQMFAAMLQARLAKPHEGHLRNIQYGFRAKKGTIHHLFCPPQGYGMVRDDR